MFDSLPVELIVKIFSYLDVKAEYEFSFSSPLTREIYKARLQSRLATVLATPTTNQFIQFLTCIQDNAQDGLAILLDETCKKILLEKRPKILPHWMLSLAECQIDLVAILLEKDDYKNSLSPSEFRYLVRNYSVLETLVKEKNIAEPLELELSTPGIEFDEDDIDEMPLSTSECR
ncbi:F-box protein [Legionella tunisiensis]|uniref:F-box protein n=1 Tax=Legionella tunisiensis TaxID=1034944 RepID=UPI0002F610A1|nr:F-box protein [Legionella tunisiensis]